MEGGRLFRVSIDVGGTFTDLVALEEGTGKMFNFKVPSVPKNPERGVIDAFGQYLQSRDPSSVGMVGHATTIATNALFGQVDLELPKTAMITTKGFRDVIEIGRQRRAEVYNLFFQRPPMLVSRRYRYEVEERVDATGNVLIPLNEADVERALEDMEREGVESLAIGLINSYLNQSHEERVLETVKSRLPSVHCTASSHISSGYREYERFSTAVVNSTLIPIIDTYITRLARDLKENDVSAPLYVMQSNGGIAQAKIVAERPATIVESGPASGVIASAWLGELVGRQEVISFDMGGTTAKAGTVRGRVPEVVQEYEVAGKVHMGRLLKGSGYPVRFPFIDLAECSAGGGTIAWADEAGALNVGPTSAGAMPGPACYGKGGKDATITDANLILGRLNPDSLLGGEMEIFPELARKTLGELAGALGTGAEKAAASIVRIANSMMSKILRIVSVERGFDPRGYTLVAFGGAGPMHACALANELEIGEVVVPPNPGMFSALGLLTADLFHDCSRALVRRVGEVTASEVESLFEEMEATGREILQTEGVDAEAMSFLRHLDLRYLGQSYELSIDVTDSSRADVLQQGVEAFHRRHREIYGYGAEDEPAELVNVRVRAVGEIPQLQLSDWAPTSVAAPSMRKVFFEDHESWLETPVYDRGTLSSGGLLDGPAIIEQYDSTTVIYPGWRVVVDKYGILSLRRVEE